jgi:hypothetical protein
MLWLNVVGCALKYSRNTEVDVYDIILELSDNETIQPALAKVVL